MLVTLTKLESVNTNLRTPSVVGVAPNPPEVGERFVVLSDPLESGDIRYISTSEVVAIEGDTFRTRNSTYRLVVEGEDDQPENRDAYEDDYAAQLPVGESK